MKAKLDAIIKQEQAEYLDRLLPASNDLLAEMEVYASKLPDTIGDVVGREEAADQARALAEAHNVEWLVADLGPDEPERETRLADIERAAGIFTALATTMRASR